MKKIAFIALIVCAVVACTKDKFTTKPQIEISSYNTKVVGQNTNAVIQLKFTDKEGDLNNGTFVYIPVRANKRRVPASQKSYDSVASTIPEFPSNSSGLFAVTIPWNSMHQDYILENDTIYFRFVVVDKAGNKSDTVNSANVVFLQQ